jgi:hypothetical protein
MFRQQFYKPALLVLNNQKASDHSRQPVSITANRIETAKRMADGTLRKYYVATKHELNVSWELLPHTANYTVDGFMGARELETMYESTPGAFQVTLVSGQIAKNGDAVFVHQGRSYKADSYLMHFKDFSLEVEKRGNAYDMYNVSMTLEEI